MKQICQVLIQKIYQIYKRDLIDIVEILMIGVIEWKEMDREDMEWV